LIGSNAFCRQLDIGQDEDVTIVTNAPNVGSRTVGKKLAVATVGTEVEGVIVSKRSIGGTMSEGMLLDSTGLGWGSGAAGNAALMPDSVEIGAPPPVTKPRLDAGAASEPTTSSAATDKKKAKEEAKAAAKAAREARKEMKSKGGKGGAEAESGVNAEVDE